MIAALLVEAGAALERDGVPAHEGEWWWDDRFDTHPLSATRGG